MPDRVLSVKELNNYVALSIATDPMLHSVMVAGEISNCKSYASGHFYFTLKDSDASVRCVMFRSYAERLAFRLADGLRVILSGQPALYQKDGQFQIQVTGAKKDGVGALYEEFERRKRRLFAEGLFDEVLKRPLPLLPRRVGVVTSESGAVWHDILSVSKRRNPKIPLLLCPSQVQGADAPKSIISALNAIQTVEDVDVVIIGRGGGSFEDLFCFSDESLARAIRASRVPIVSAVGHETDVSIADMAADMRAPTPSAAAEMVFPVYNDLRMTLLELNRSLYDSACAANEKRSAELRLASARLSKMEPNRNMSEKQRELHDIAKRLALLAASGISGFQMKLKAVSSRLESVSPQNALKNGYALITMNNSLVRSAKTLKAGDDVRIKLFDGSLSATINNVRSDMDGSEKARL
ncbi:MAG: exodeoxyribonuclease VII large subunit [Eubacteriales bacterium]|nr:exodeoxyribonuclease VII large subunit [Eubacteriales bacterium]MDD3882233.1 exodeoxyribonuclease VII large subunit [Eubacteriales bacterium]MDD4512582.1 exodeoxyribonuclease VII large subunit [Eubacteriales bacterium]